MAVDLVAVQQQLSDAQAKYHQLLTGQMARVFVDQNGERLEFTAARRSDLLAYIQWLQGQLGQPDILAYNRQPLGFLF